MTKSCHISKISVHVLLFLFFDTKQITFGVEYNANAHSSKDESFQEQLKQIKVQSFSKVNPKVKVDYYFAKACDIISWLDHFAKPLVSSALKLLTLLTHIPDVWRAFSKCKVCAFKLKFSKGSYELKKSKYLIILVLSLVKRGYFFMRLSA